MGAEHAMVAPANDADLRRLLEGALVPEETSTGVNTPEGLGRRVSMEDVMRSILGRGVAQVRDPVGECLNALQRELRDFVKSNTREVEAFGFGSRGGDPLDCGPIRKLIQDTAMKLEGIGEAPLEPSPLALAQRSVIPQVVSMLEDFLVDLSSVTSEGQVNQSDIAPVLRSFISLRRAVGEVVQALAGMRLEMMAAGTRT